MAAPLPGRRSRERIERIVLDQLEQAAAPIGAYELSWRAGKAGEPLVPNQVYRTLARLIERGSVCRLETLSAYMLKTGEAAACLICDSCHAASMIDAPDVLAGIERCASDAAFRRETAMIEIHGHCSDCATAGANKPVDSPA